MMSIMDTSPTGSPDAAGRENDAQPQTLRRPSLPTPQLIRYLVGFFLCGIMWVIPWSASIQILLPQRFADLGIASPTNLVAAINSIGAVVALISNIVFGALSDRTRSRLGKRTPYIIGGALFSGICLFFSFVATSPALIVLAWAGMQIGLNALLAPFLATLSDRIPEANRGVVSAVYGLSFVVGSSLGNYVGAAFIQNLVVGAIAAACCIGIAGLLVFLIWPKEASTLGEAKQKLSVRQLAASFSPPRGAHSSDLYKALFGEMSITCGYFMVYSFILYLFTQYIGLSTTSAQGAIQAMVLPTMIASIIAAGLAGPISDKIQRRKPLILVAALLMAASFLIPWIWPTRTAMVVWAVIAGFAYGMYSAMTQALNVAVLPAAGNAGKDLGFLNMSSTVGQVVGSIVTATLFSVTGSYRAVFPVAIVFMILAFILIFSIKRTK